MLLADGDGEFDDDNECAQLFMKQNLMFMQTINLSLFVSTLAWVGCSVQSGKDVSHINLLSAFYRQKK